MKILSLRIKEYGSLIDRNFDLSDGINIFEGENESGKSTILSFIKFIFYGLPKRASGETVSEREKYLSWRSGVADGTLTFENEDGRFRIERKGILQVENGKGTYRETFRVIDLAEGTGVKTDPLSPGEYFLGVPLSVFESTACLKQLECSEIDGEDINTAIENILFSASESIDVPKTLAKLEGIRRPLLHKNEKGGQVFELSLEKERLEGRLGHAKAVYEELAMKESRAESLRKEVAGLTSELSEIDRKRRQSETLGIIRRFDELHECEGKIKALALEDAGLKENLDFAEHAPTKEDLAKLIDLRRDIDESENERLREDLELQSFRNESPADKALSDVARTIRSLGDKAAVLRRYSLLKKSYNISLSLGLCLTLLGAGALIGGGALFLAKVLIPSFIALGGGLALGVSGALLFVSKKKKKAAFVAFLSEIGIYDPDVRIGEIEAHIDECFRNEQLNNASDLKITGKQTSIDAIDKHLRALYEEASSLLPEFGIDAAGNDREAVRESLSSLRDRAEKFCSSHEKLLSDISNLENYVRIIESGLAGYNEASLRSSLAASKIETSESHDELTRRYDFCRDKQKSLDEKRIELEKEIIAISKTSENPAVLSEALEQLDKELDKTSLLANAVILAIDTLNEASTSLRSSVTPRIKERAERYLEALSGGKYTEIGVDRDLCVSITADGTTHPIDVMSAGTKDAAYLCLRLALLEFVSDKKHIPLILDEALSQMDNKRAANALSMLREYSSEGNQIILFTCHTREAGLIGNAPFNKITL